MVDPPNGPRHSHQAQHPSMFDRQSLRDRIHTAVSRTLAVHPPAAGQLYSITLALPEIHFRGLPQLRDCQSYWYWRQPEKEEYLFGAGEALRIDASGSTPIQHLAGAFQQLQARWRCLDPDHTAIPPAAFSGFAFVPQRPMISPWKGLPNAAIFLPEILTQQRNNRCSLCFSHDIASESRTELLVERWLALFDQLLQALDRKSGPPGQRTRLTRTRQQPDPQTWHALVQQAKESIRNSDLEKVVLTRQIRVEAQRRLDPGRLMATLDCLYPSSRHLAFRIGEHSFVAATPERLLACQGSQINCDAIGGTSRRSADEREDKILGESLLNNPKALHEHALVVDTIQHALTPICSRFEPSSGPQLLPLRGLQHLHTEIQGSLKPDTSLLQAAARLHPTGAVNGVPTAVASQWLAQHEALERGWYTGAAGWINAEGDGELAVLLRCALLDGSQAHLYAGAGITAGSDPEAEFDETELKLAAMLEALENA